MSLTTHMLEFTAPRVAGLEVATWQLLIDQKIIKTIPTFRPPILSLPLPELWRSSGRAATADWYHQATLDSCPAISNHLAEKVLPRPFRHRTLDLAVLPPPPCRPFGRLLTLTLSSPFFAGNQAQNHTGVRSPLPSATFEDSDL